MPRCTRVSCRSRAPHRRSFDSGALTETSYTEPPSARSVAVSEQVIPGLRRLGFSERDSKSAVGRVLETMESLCAETRLRAAIAMPAAPFC
ncbi:MAG TPA: RuvA C-terminal domain-containing protein [Polyangiaceae bacterium]|nr:RuvA C-terminal domain-containing protein [Polyangiaceae bacterium]